MAEEIRLLAESAAHAVREASETATRIRYGIEQVMTGMERGLAESDEGLELAGSLETALQDLKRLDDGREQRAHRGRAVPRDRRGDPPDPG